MIRLGDKVKDVITGFAGIVVARTDWLYGCVRIGVQPEKLPKDGKMPEPTWIDEDQLKEIQSSRVKGKIKTTGGHRAAPVRNLDPKR